jgi:hypothetical protein
MTANSSSIINGKRLALAAMGGTAIGSALIAGLTVWLLVTQPMMVAHAVTDHDMTPVLQAVLGVLRDLVVGLVRYL